MEKRRYEVGKLSELKPDRGKTVALGESGEECTLFLHEGKVYAVGSLCPHQNAPLDGAPSQRGQVLCVRHFYCFELATGNCTTAGGYGIPTYEVTLEEDTISVWNWDFDS